MKAFRIAAVLSCLGTPCLAQSAEETALYLLTGLIDGAVTPDKKAKLNRVSDRRFVLRALDGSGEEGELQVVMKSPCDVTVYMVQKDKEKVVLVHADFAKIGDISVSKDNIEFKGDEKSVCSWDLFNGGCDWTTKVPTLTVIDKARHQKAYAYYKEKFCRGRAF